jgi:hypothetical protein
MAEDLFTDGEASPSRTTGSGAITHCMPPHRAIQVIPLDTRLVPLGIAFCHRKRSDRLGFLLLDEWDESGEYDVQPPQYVCYPQPEKGGESDVTSI